MPGKPCAWRQDLAGRTGPTCSGTRAATWFMNSGIDVAIISDFLGGMSVEVLTSVYGHHHPLFQAQFAQVTPKKQVNRKRTG